MKEKMQNICGLNPEIYYKGDYKGINFAKFGTPVDRNEAVSMFGKAQVFHGEHRVWISPDRPMDVRCQLKFLFAIKNSLVEACDFSKNGLWVDDSDLALYWHGDLVASTRIDADVLQVAFGPTWQEYLKEINVTDLYAQSNEVLQMSLASRAKGKGKGKGKGEGKHDVAHPTQVFGVSMEDY